MHTALEIPPARRVAWPIAALVIGALSQGVSRTVSLDSRQVAALFQAHGAFVYRRALRLLGNKEDADEATQEIFVRLCTGSRPPEGSTLEWLSRVTTNYCLNRLRDHARRRQLLDARVAPVASDLDAEKAHLIAEVRALIARADPKQAEAALYVYVDGLSQDEAAEMLGVSQRTVSNLLARFSAWAREQSELPKEGGTR